MSVSKLRPRGRIVLAVFNVAAGIGGAIVLFNAANGLFGNAAVPTASAQVQDPYLSRRIDMVEQRFYQIESRLNRLESDALRSQPLTPGRAAPADTELPYLRSQIDALRVRLGEVECGVLRLDERTLPAPQRLGKKKASQGHVDACREDYASPITLSSRP